MGEQERKDRIDVRQDLRNDVKQRWKEVRWAERRVLKLLDKKIFSNAALAARGSREINESDNTPVGKASITVAFNHEENDPFGGCEVVTTDLDSMNGVNLWPV